MECMTHLRRVLARASAGGKPIREVFSGERPVHVGAALSGGPARNRLLTLTASLLLLGLSTAHAETPDPRALYRQHCADCHGSERLGGMGPALLPQNLKRLRKKEALRVLSDGRAATQMPAFGNTLNAAERQALVDYIYQSPAVEPRWEQVDIVASHQLPHPPGSLPDKPVFQADLMNLFVVVELGDHHVTVLNGDTFEPIHRFKSRFALHGGPKYSPDGRYVYFASRDGWITKYDLYNLKVVAEIRAGINTRNLAVSSDGRYVLVGNYLPHSLVVLDARDLSLLQHIEVSDEQGQTSRVSAVYNAPPRNSFIVALKDLPAVWELSYEGLSSMTSRGALGERSSGLAPLAIRRIQVADYLDDFLFDQQYRYVMGATRPRQQGKQRTAQGQVVDLKTGDRVATLDLGGMPHLGSGITWQYRGRTVMATPNLSTGQVSVIDMTSWDTVKTIPTLGPGFFMRSHANSRYAWVDVFFGPNRDAVHVIDKQTLEIVKMLRPAPGKTAAHVEFTKDGRYALLSVWDMDGALVVYDAETLEEVKRLPMVKPSGKYNVYNKIHYAAGTSH